MTRLHLLPAFAISTALVGACTTYTTSPPIVEPDVSRAATSSSEPEVPRRASAGERQDETTVSPTTPVRRIEEPSVSNDARGGIDPNAEVELGDPSGTHCFTEVAEKAYRAWVYRVEIKGRRVRINDGSCSFSNYCVFGRLDTNGDIVAAVTTRYGHTAGKVIARIVRKGQGSLWLRFTGSLQPQINTQELQAERCSGSEP